MSLFAQITFGTFLLGASAIIHVLVLFAVLPLLRRIAKLPIFKRDLPRIVGLVSMMLAAILASHGLQIWLWAAIWLGFGAFSELPTALYFSAVTYTTLGYGDIVLDPGIRLFATFSAVCGLLGFGISTAFLVGLVSRLLPDYFEE